MCFRLLPWFNEFCKHLKTLAFVRTYFLELSLISLKLFNPENYSPLYPAPKFLIQLCSQSNILFTRATAVFQTILRDTPDM